MKRVLCVFLAVVMLLSMAACGKDEPEATEGGTVNQPAQQEKPAETEAPKPEETEASNEEWGIPRTHSNSNKNGFAFFDISFPHLVGIPEASGLIGYQDDDTVVIVDEEIVAISPDVDNVEDILPTYFEQTEVILRMYYTDDYTDHEFTIDSQELVDINGYKMSKYEGAWKFNLSGEPVSYQYTAYGVLLNANEGVVYWMVLDTTDDQSLKDLIDSHAYNMALSLEEFEI